MNSTISRTKKGFEGYNKSYTKVNCTVYFQLVSLSETITEQDHVTNTLVSILSCYLQEGSLLWTKNTAGNQPKSQVYVTEANG